MVIDTSARRLIRSCSSEVSLSEMLGLSQLYMRDEGFHAVDNKIESFNTLKEKTNTEVTKVQWN